MLRVICDYDDSSNVYLSTKRVHKIFSTSTVPYYTEPLTNENITKINKYLRLAFDDTVFIDVHRYWCWSDALCDHQANFLKLLLFVFNAEPRSIILQNVDAGLRPKALRALFDLIEEIARTKDVIVVTSSPMLLNLCDISYVYKCIGGIVHALASDSNVVKWAEHYSLGNLYMSETL